MLTPRINPKELRVLLGESKPLGGGGRRALKFAGYSVFASMGFVVKSQHLDKCKYLGQTTWFRVCAIF
jgi:hypothetical protein